MKGHVGGEAHSRYLMELSFLPQGARVLDMGAGDGKTVRLLRELGFEAEGIDLNPAEDVTAAIISTRLMPTIALMASSANVAFM